MTGKKTIVMSNAEPADFLFHNDRGSWNVTRAVRDCKTGKHRQYLAERRGGLCGQSRHRVRRGEGRDTDARR